MRVRRVGLIRRKDSAIALSMGEEVRAWLIAKGVEVELDVIRDGMDLLVILGGDGTLLHVADQASLFGVAVVGVNLGDLGFLTEVGGDERFAVLEAILAGEVVVEERMMLKARLVAGGEPGAWEYALNDVVVGKGHSDQLVRLCVWADQHHLTTYRADGLIFSTPTGSTAYNLSAGGPIVHPALHSILVTPICPFMLGSRPVLLSAVTRLTIQLASQGGAAQVVLDGQPGWELAQDAVLEVMASERPLRLICSPQKDYFAILRNKLNWGGSGPVVEGASPMAGGNPSSR
ncbi:MAG: NAD(+)/NADH kinase [Thermodesulfobacteriota bacterium]